MGYGSKLVKNNINDSYVTHDNQARVASQISGGTTNPNCMSPSLNKQLDFNIQIKYKNVDKENTHSPYFGNKRMSSPTYEA